MTKNRGVKLNNKSQLRIANAIDAISNELTSVRHCSLERAKKLLRDKGIYETIQDVTMDRIGSWGDTDGKYKYDATHGFYLEDTPTMQTVQKLSGYIDAWIRDTCVDGSISRILLTGRVLNILRKFGDPDTTVDVVEIAQNLNETTRRDTHDWTVLGSFRSFAAWGIDKGLFQGNKNLLWRTSEKTPIQVGSNTAIVIPGTMTNTKNQWTWRVLNGGISTEFVGTEAEVLQHLTNLSAEVCEDLEDLSNYFDDDVLLSDENIEPDSERLDELVNQIKVIEGNKQSDLIWIPRLIAERALQLCNNSCSHGSCRELAGLIRLYMQQNS